jgi:hypothetical protein
VGSTLNSIVPILPTAFLLCSFLSACRGTKRAPFPLSKVRLALFQRKKEIPLETARRFRAAKK